MDRQIEAAISEFQELLMKRLRAGVHTTEDGIRYTFFAALIKSGFPPEQIVPEYPHPNIKRAEIDTVIVGENGRPEAAIEFKYHRDIPSGKATPRPMKAGQLFADLVRLSLVPVSCTRLFAYVTDPIMARYFHNQPSPLSDLFDLRPSATLGLTSASFHGRPPTFHNAMGGWPSELRLRILSIVKQELPKDHHLRICEVTLMRENEGK